MAVLTPRSVFRRYEVDGVPSSGHHKVIKDEVVQLLEQIFGVSRGGWVVTQTLAELNGVTPESETDGGVVLADPDPANNGYYQRDSGAWVRGRGFPDTFARVALSGSVSAQTGVVETGVNPADVEVFFAFVGAENDGPLTLAIGGEAPREVVNLAGNALSAGEWTGAVMFALRDGKYQLLLDAGAAASAAQSASDAKDEADRAEGEADRAVVARLASEDARDLAEQYRDDAQGYAADALGAKTQAELAAIAAGAPLYTSEPDLNTAPSPYLLQVEAGTQVYTHDGTAATLVGWLGKVSFKTVAALLAFTGPLGPAGTEIEAQGFRYEAAASDATDWHVETVGGVKVKVLPGSNGYNVEAFGAVGDGLTDESSIVQTAAQASSLDYPLVLNGGAYIVGLLTLSSPIKIIGTGTIRKKPGTTGHLILSTADLEIFGPVTIDQNAENCPNESATGESDCAIRHSGPSLYLDRVIIPASLSANVRTNASESCVLNECNLDGGYMNLLAAVGTGCKVRITGGRYSNAHRDDAIQVHNSLDFVIDGVEACHAYRSGIVVVNAAGNGRISNNYCHSNKIDTVHNQGGWGIVCSVAAHNITIIGNVCRNNQRGPCTVDVYDAPPAPTYRDAHTVVMGNIFDGEYDGGQSATGLGLNGSRFVTVVGNRIRNVSQGILGVDSYMALVSGNTFEDCGAAGGGYFVQFLNSSHIKVSGNLMVGLAAASVGAIGFYDGSNFEATDNRIAGLKGQRAAFLINDTEDFRIESNYIEKDDTGSGFIIVLQGVVSHGRIRNNRAYSPVAAWQWYINAQVATITDIATENNEISVPSINYIYMGSAIVSSGDSRNGTRDYHASAPTSFSSRQGQVAVIAGSLKFWNGSAWV